MTGDNPKPPSGVPERGAIEPIKGTEEEARKRPPAPEKFESYMKETPPAEEEAGRVSPMDITKGPLPPTTKPTPETISEQINSGQVQLGNTRNKVDTLNNILTQFPNAKLKEAQQNLLQQKLLGANTHLRTAAKNLQIERPPLTLDPEATPIEKWFAYLDDGQKQLEQARSQLSTLGAQGQLDPAKLLLIQTNLAIAQQEIEYSSVLLSKVIDGLRTTLNIQI